MTDLQTPITLITAAKMIGGQVKVSTLRAAGHSGALEVWKLGGRLFTTQLSVQAWFDASRVRTEKRKPPGPLVDKRQIPMFEEDTP